MTGACEHCSGAFVRRSVTHRFCSKECRIAAKRSSVEVAAAEWAERKRQIDRDVVWYGRFVGAGIVSVIVGVALLIHFTAGDIKPAQPGNQYAPVGTRCADGWVSDSTGSGTCSWHGGIAEGYDSSLP
ncbi:MAG: hypothetical protein QOJ13_958 [Gaiellales bacterium]|jgi:hypothetical protein|nr:hypothetical protein [Gaiellales bacterium]